MKVSISREKEGAVRLLRHAATAIYLGEEPGRRDTDEREQMGRRTALSAGERSGSMEGGLLLSWAKRPQGGDRSAR